jgi:uncharacterized membrane protein
MLSTALSTAKLSTAKPWIALVVVAAVAGILFAGVSVYDAALHLDRQVHGLHCSLLPLGATDLGADSGCKVALLSPYASLFRDRIWGGIPIALPALSVFAYTLWLVIGVAAGRSADRRATGWLLVVAAVPLIASLIMAMISAFVLGTLCMVCVGLYVASGLGFAGALGLYLHARRSDPPAAPWRGRWPAIAVGALFVAVPVAGWAATVPDHGRFIGACGTLPRAEDPHGVLLPIDDPATAGPAAPIAIEVLDPLCPACRAFEERLATAGLEDGLARRALLFPLDATCNWMVTETVHPGACGLSEALLCAGGLDAQPGRKAADMLAWIFAEQETLAAAGRTDAAAPARMATDRFPEIRDCLASTETRVKLNRSLKWAVANQIPVLTPQLFVGGAKLCDEDTDLGLEFALPRLIRRAAAATKEPSP